MKLRRALMVGLTCLAALATTATTAHADEEGLLVPGPATVWAIDGDEATELGLDTPPTTYRVCGIGRSLLLRQVSTLYTWQVHAVTQACHTYLPATRQFYLENRVFLCEKALQISTRDCPSGSFRSGTTLSAATLYVEFRADGGNPLFRWRCPLDAPRLRNLEGGNAEYCRSTALTGAVGHRYNAWGYASFNVDGVGSKHMDAEGRISMSPETYVAP